MPDCKRHSAAHLLELGSACILLDCGPGTLHGFDTHDVKWGALSHVAISHYHNDHVGDLAAVLFAMKHALRPPRVEPLVLVGPAGFRDFVGRLADALGDHVLDPGFEVRVVEMEESDVFVDPGGTFELRSCPTPHTDESVAFRLEGGFGRVGYTGDTGPSDVVAHFLAGCDVLVAECALADPPEMDLHLSPHGVAHMADIARPGLLVLTHVYPFQTPDEAVRAVSERYDGAVLAARDGLRIVLRPDGPAVDLPLTAV